MELEGGVVVKGRVTIDTRPPFRSVKEAVALFGEKVLAGAVYGPKLEQVMMENNVEGGNKQVQNQNRGAMKTELEETKQRLERSTEEKKSMENTLQLLRQELEEKRRELQDHKSKSRESYFYYGEPMIIDPEIEEIKFVSNNDDVGPMLTNYETQQELRRDSGGDESKIQVPTLKKFVSFASPPSLVKEMDRQQQEKGVLARDSSFIKGGKKKPLGWLFSKKKRNA